jgi:site-specific DNA recombinase
MLNMSSEQSGLTAGYERLSLDKDGNGLAIERQRQDNDARALSLGWGVVSEHYTDNDVTADPKKAVRPAFQRLLADMRAGKVSRVVCYDQDRLVRDMRELEDIADAVEAGGVEFTSVNGDIDLRTDNGIMIARIKAAVARNELDKISRRTARQKQQRVEAGKPLGQRFRTFGYERDWTVNEEEAEVVKEVFRRATAGESQNGITADLKARGIKTAAGGEWTPLQTSRMLKTPKYAGLQTYKGEVIGKSTVIPALVSEAEYEAVQNPQNGASFNFRKYLLSGIVHCWECKAPMSGFKAANNGSVRYRCDVRNGGCGKVSIKAMWVEGLVDRYMSWYVSNQYAERLRAEPVVEENNEEAIKAADERISKLQASLGSPDLSYEDGIAALKVARAERNRLVKEDAQRVKKNIDLRDAIKDYDALADDAKRVEIKKVFKFIFVRPGRRVRYFDENRILALTHLHGDKLVPGGAINTVDYRDDWNEGSRIADPEERGFDKDRGF